MIPGLFAPIEGDGGVWTLVAAGSGTGYTTVYPTGLQDGDIAFIASASTSSSTTAPTGATVISNRTGSSPSRSCVTSYRRLTPALSGAAIGGGGNRKVAVFRCTNRSQVPELDQKYTLSTTGSISTTIDLSAERRPVLIIVSVTRSENSRHTSFGSCTINGVTASKIDSESNPDPDYGSYARAQFWWRTAISEPASYPVTISRGSNQTDNVYHIFNLRR